MAVAARTSGRGPRGSAARTTPRRGDNRRGVDDLCRLGGHRPRSRGLLDVPHRPRLCDDRPRYVGHRAARGDAFYVAPDPLPDGNPGDLIRSREIPGPNGAKGWTVMYLSRSASDQPIAVTGTVFAPSQTTDPSIVAWAHGTTGLGDACTPSKMAAGGEGSEVLLGTAVVSRGLVFVATDYEGLGTPGVHTYLVGQSEGRAVLDSIRAAAGCWPPVATKAVGWGHSQGGGAALWAAELAPTYAPDANLLGVVAGAPAAQLEAFGASLGESTTFGFQLMALAGFHAAYPELSLDEVVTPDGAAAVEAAGDQCTAETFAAVAGEDPARYFQPGAASATAWLDALAANDPGHGTTTVPIFIYHGDADDIVPVQVSEIVADAYCANGVTVSRKVYPGADHTSVIIAAVGDINATSTHGSPGRPRRRPVDGQSLSGRNRRHPRGVVRHRVRRGVGDKSQLLTLALATGFGRFRCWRGSVWRSPCCAASRRRQAVSGLTIPERPVTVAAGVLFIVFGIWTLRPQRDDAVAAETEEAAGSVRSERSQLLAALGAFFFAELGDKTQLATLTLATQRTPLAVWAGATLGMFTATALPPLVGRVLGTRFPERSIRIAAAALFLGFGGLLVLDGLTG